MLFLERYFGNFPLVTQSKKTVRFYRDDVCFRYFIRFSKLMIIKADPTFSIEWFIYRLDVIFEKLLFLCNFCFKLDTVIELIRSDLKKNYLSIIRHFSIALKLELITYL